MGEKESFFSGLIRPVPLVTCSISHGSSHTGLACDSVCRKALPMAYPIWLWAFSKTLETCPKRSYRPPLPPLPDNTEPCLLAVNQPCWAAKTCTGERLQLAQHVTPQSAPGAPLSTPSSAKLPVQQCKVGKGDGDETGRLILFGV